MEKMTSRIEERPNTTGHGTHKVLIVEAILQRPTPSGSGKTLIVATTNGFMQGEAEVDGKKIAISLNACVKP
jgi:hypothetical protein